MASCGAEYEESRWSEALTDKTLHSVGFSEDMSGALGATGSIIGMSYASKIKEDKKKELRTVTIGDSRNYYTCAYLDRETVKLIEENPGFSTVGTFWSGKSYYITYYRQLVAEGKLDAAAHPIRWIEIPKTVDIPNKYKGMTLAMICESREASVTDLATGEITKRESFYELRELYGEALSAQYERYRDTQFPEAMLIYGDFNYGEDIFTMIELYDMHYYRGLDVEAVDGTDYVISRAYTVFDIYDYAKNERGLIDLTEACGYQNIGGAHYFALSDLVDIYMTYNIEPVG
jgi:hypothetical protein